MVAFFVWLLVRRFPRSRSSVVENRTRLAGVSVLCGAILSLKDGISLIFGHGAVDFFQGECWKNVSLGIGVPTVAHAEAPQSLRARGPFHQEMGMLRVDLYRKLEHMERPDGSRRPSVLNRQFALNLTAEVTEQTVVGTFVRASLPNRRKSKQQDES